MSQMTLIPHSFPDIDPEDISVLKDCLDRGFVGWDEDLEEVLGKDIKKFVCKDQVVITPSGSMGLLVALRRLGVKAGDPVLIPAIPGWSVYNAIEFLGAVPVICDIRNSQDLRSSFDSITRQVIGQIKVVVVTHMFGVLIEQEDIRRLKEELKLHVIEDYASSFGARYNNTDPVGRFADFVIGSFNSTKPITSGAGGFIAANEVFLSDAREKPVDGLMAVNCKISCLNQRLLQQHFIRFEKTLEQKEKLRKLFSRFVKIYGDESNALYRAITFDQVDGLKSFFYDHGFELDIRDSVQANFAQEYGLNLENARNLKPYKSIPFHTKFVEALEMKGLL